MKKQTRDYDNLMVNRLGNALLSLWDKPTNKKAQEVAGIVLKDFIALQEEILKGKK